MDTLRAWLGGKKSYLCAGLIFLAGLMEFLAKGDFSITAIGAFSKTSAVAGAVAAVRAAIAKQRPA